MSRMLRTTHPTWLRLLLVFLPALFGADSGRVWAQESRSPAQDGADAAKESSDTPKKNTDDATTRLKEASPPVALKNPRTAMQSFLIAVEESSREKPARIRDAVACIDTSQLDAKDRDERAKLLARRLYSVVDKIGVRLDDIPEETSLSSFIFYQLEEDESGAGGAVISLVEDDGDWRFSARTLDSIPRLEAHLRNVESEVAAKKAETDVPAQYRTPRALMKTFIDAMNAQPPDYSLAAACFDPGDVKDDIWAPESLQLAVQLKNVIDKTKLVVFSEIPENVTGDDPYVWHPYDSGTIEIGLIEDGPLKGQWRFTVGTASSLDALYQELLNKPLIRELRQAGVEEDLTLALRIERIMPPSLRRSFLYLDLWQWLAVGALILIGWGIRVVISRLTGSVLRRYIAARQKNIDLDAFDKVMLWAGYSANAGFWLIMVPRLGFPTAALAYLLPGLKFICAFAITWLCYRLVDVIAGYIASDKELRITHFDDLLLPLLRTVLRTLVAILVILFVMEWVFDQPPQTVLGALGIGGVAIAFAAKDTLGNFFGSLTLLFDRPFGIGDWVVIGGVEGTVEHVGFRSTRIRTFYNSKITIPNSTMTTTPVDNFGARKYRRLKVNLTLTYNTPPERIEAFCEGVRELIRLHQYTRKDYYHVYFNQFSDSSLDVLLYMFFNTPDWSTELRERHNLFLDILRLARELGVEFAYPTQTLWLNRDAGSGSDSDGKAMSPSAGGEWGVEAAAGVYQAAYGTEHERRSPVVIERNPRSSGSDGSGVSGRADTGG